MGAINEVTLRFFNPETKTFVDKTFREQMEISNLTGNISTMNGNLTYMYISLWALLIIHLMPDICYLLF